jgi:hypothetical protein
MSSPLQFLKCLCNYIYLKMSYKVAVYTVSCTCGPITARYKPNITASPCSLVVLKCEKYALLRAGRNDAHC